MAIIIHDIWLIEENATILRKCIEFNPPRAPEMADKMADSKAILIKIGLVRR